MSTSKIIDSTLVILQAATPSCQGEGRDNERGLDGGIRGRGSLLGPSSIRLGPARDTSGGRLLSISASRRTKFLQFHGFGTAAGDAQVSDGSTRDDQDPNPSSVSVALRDALRLIAPNKTIFSCQVDGMGGGRKLCGTTNIEGRSSNEASGADECRAPTAQSTDRFLHLEQVRTFRNLDVEQHLVERALSSVWGDCNLAEDGADCDLGDPQPSFADYSCSDHVPVASAGPNRTVECASPSGTSVLLDATASSDPDGDPISYQWSASQGTLESPNEPQATIAARE